MKSRLKSLVGVGVGALFVYGFARSLDWSKVWAEVRQADGRFLGLAAALFLVTYLIRALRWRVLLEPMAQPPRRALMRATAVGFAAFFVMGRAGELIVRPAVLSVKDRVHPSASYATVMIERVFDMVMVVALFALNLVFFAYVARDRDSLRAFEWIKFTGFGLFAVAAAGVWGLSVFRRRRNGVLSFLERRLARLPGRLGRAILSLLQHISEGLAVLHDRRELARVGSYTLLLWLLNALAHLTVVRAFDVPYAQVSFAGAIFVMGISTLGSVIPTPGGATGPFHTAAASALIFLGVEVNKAASVAIALHMVIFAPITLIGLLYVVKGGLSLGRLRRIGERQVKEVDELEAAARHEEESQGALATQTN